MLKFAIVAFAFVAAGSVAQAEDTVIHEHDAPGITITKPAPPPDVVIKKREPSVTVGRGDCDTKTVRKEDDEGSTTVKKKRCD